MRNLTMIAVVENGFGVFRSDPIYTHYFVEANTRRSSYAFFVPSVESNGVFLGMSIETNSTLRAQGTGTQEQELADYFSVRGVGPYQDQSYPLRLTDIDPDLKGFEGGFSVNTTDGRHFGVIIPYHNGRKFFGKVVKIDLFAMIENVTLCNEMYVIETMINGTVNTTGTANISSACVHVIDVSSLHERAVGFMKGFSQLPFGYLSPGQYDVAVRLNMENFMLNTTRVFDLSLVSTTYGGYSGGFADGSWACFTPYRTYAGPVGGLRSRLPVDAKRTRPFFHAQLTCVNDTVWNPNFLNSTSYMSTLAAAGTGEVSTSTIFDSAVQMLDLSALVLDLRGYSDSNRQGRYVYLSPLSTNVKTANAKLLRIFLGDVDVGTMIQEVNSGQRGIGDMLDALDLSQINKQLAGYSSVVAFGKYIYLVPFRNVYDTRFGNRGHGLLTRVNMNSFNLAGVDFVNLTTTKRKQIPDIEDIELTGFSGGMASGKYVLLTPYYNGVFNGKAARIDGLKSTLDKNVQSVDARLDRKNPNVYKAFRGGFISLWRANFDEVNL
jgi:hypothetical protein